MCKRLPGVAPRELICCIYFLNSEENTKRVQVEKKVNEQLSGQADVKRLRADV